LLWSGGAALAPEQPAADEEIEAARAVLAQLAHHGIDLETVGRQLQRAGLLQIEQEFTEPAALAA
jgi:transketolase/transaldolase